jgi:hypothetical protein
MKAVRVHKPGGPEGLVYMALWLDPRRNVSYDQVSKRQARQPLTAGYTVRH